MRISIFYSWQTDLPNPINRGFIESALNRAIKAVKSSSEIKTDVCIDRDTQNAAGTPDIANTIFDKVRKATIFVGDVSIINSRSKTRHTPNPNVLIELGYAANHVGWDNIICVFNYAYGRIEELPFDIRNRRILTYYASLEQQKRTDERNALARRLQEAIQSILDKATALHALEKEVFLDISLACHSWKIEYMSLSPAHFSEPEGKQFLDVWELMIEQSKHKYSIEEWKRFIPLFDGAIVFVLQRLDRMSALHPEVLPLEFKTLLMQTKRELEFARSVYLSLPNYVGSSQDKDEFFSYQFVKVIEVLSKLARTAEMLRGDRSEQADAA